MLAAPYSAGLSTSLLLANSFRYLYSGCLSSKVGALIENFSRCCFSSSFLGSSWASKDLWCHSG
jgi:hypothetical protein